MITGVEMVEIAMEGGDEEEVGQIWQRCEYASREENIYMEDVDDVNPPTTANSARHHPEFIY